MKKRVLLFLGSISFGFLFLLFSLAAKKDFFKSIDFNTTVKIQNRIPQRADDFLSFFSTLASFEIMVLLLAILVLARRKLLGFMALFAFGGSHIIELYGKTLLDHPGPAMMFYRAGAVTPIFPQWYSLPGSSYPSGHSLRAVFLGLIILSVVWSSKGLGFNLKTVISFSTVSLVFLTLLSRVSLGVHWPSDVIGGTLLGVSTALFSLVFF